MSKDIRSFFSAVSKKPSSGTGVATASTPQPAKRKAKVLLSSDEEGDTKKDTKTDIKKSKPHAGEITKKRRAIVSDDEDNESPKKNGNHRPNLSKLKLSSPTKNVKPIEKKPVNITSVFGSEPVKRSEQPSVKKSNPNATNDDLFDDDFELNDEVLEISKIDINESANKVKTPTKKVESPIKKEIFKETSTKNESQKIKKEETPKSKTQKQSSDESDHHQDEERHEKKRLAAILYQKYKNRSGPIHPGSKDLPKGKPNCLSGLSFIITGILESLDREQATELIKKYGGKVTSALSKKTNYMIIGEEAGPAKLAKAEEFNTQILSEDDLLNLIRKKSNIPLNSDANEASCSNNNVSIDDRKKSNKDLTSSIKHQKISVKKKSDSLEERVKSPKKEVKSPKKDMSNDASGTKRSIETVKVKAEPSTKKSKSEDLHVSRPVSEHSKNISSIDNQAWVEKYKPKSIKDIIGQQGAASNCVKLQNWLSKWHSNHDGKKKLQRPNPWAKNDDGSYFKAVLLSGPPGVGKTTTATLVCKDLGFDTVEFNASDTRSKKLLKVEVSELLNNQSLFGYFHGATDAITKKHVLIMDEVDGMAGNEDRGGIQELIQLIKDSHIPIICMCNDRNHQKMRSLVNYCYDLRFNRPRLEQIKAAMMSICFKESIKLPKGALDEIISSTNNDIRQTLNYLTLVSANKSIPELADNQKSTAKKDLKLGPWEVVRRVFSYDEHKNMSMNDKSDLFFHDYSLGPLFVQQNYLMVKPKCPQDEVKKRIALTADSLSLGDLVEKRIRSNMAWSMLPLQAMYSSVLPGEYMAGYITGQINFPAWLGKNSKASKRSRLAQELHDHTRIRTSGSRLSVRLDYAPFLLQHILRPLKEKGMDGVEESLNVLKEYRLLREDIDSLIELSSWPGKKNPMDSIESKVKAALTRAYNKEVAPYTYTVTAAATKKKKSGATDDELQEYGEEGEEINTADSDDDDNDTMENDVLIKAKKKDTTKASTSKKATGKNENSKSSGSSSSNKAGTSSGGRGGKPKNK